MDAKNTPQGDNIASEFTVLLVDRSTISQGETIAGLFRDNKLGILVGGATSGTNGDINSINLPGGYDISWSGLRTLNLNGSRFIGRGIHPDVPSKPTIGGIRAGRDEVLEKGILEAELPVDGQSSGH